MIRYVHARGLRFAVEVTGDGVPMVLLHGFPDSLALWRDMTPALVAAGFQVIAFDQRGYGDSDAPVGRSAYTMATIAADVPAVLDALGIDEPVTVVGHDWGAVIAWMVAIEHPRRVRNLVAISVGHPQSYGRAGFRQKFVKGFYVLWFQLPGLAERYLLAGGLRRWLGGRIDGAAAVAAMARPGRLTAALNWYRVNLLPVLFGRWGRCGVPVLAVWSDGDAYLTEGQMTQSARYTDAPFTYRCVAGCGHWIPLEQPERLAKMIVEWLRAAGRGD